MANRQKHKYDAHAFIQEVLRIFCHLSLLTKTSATIYTLDHHAVFATCSYILYQFLITQENPHVSMFCRVQTPSSSLVCGFLSTSVSYPFLFVVYTKQEVVSEFA
ncbi:unnamed protein product [Ilex paraguariensis]|uniref:Uncharacterized protein n=1 Tax=Ilex paraguariensis TaxID=185542 RepID=A0ABC8RDQ0_9AQUA